MQAAGISDFRPRNTRRVRDDIVGLGIANVVDRHGPPAVRDRHRQRRPVGKDHRSTTARWERVRHPRRAWQSAAIPVRRAARGNKVIAGRLRVCPMGTAARQQPNVKRAGSRRISRQRAVREKALKVAADCLVWRSNPWRCRTATWRSPGVQSLGRDRRYLAVPRGTGIPVLTAKGIEPRGMEQTVSSIASGSLKPAAHCVEVEVDCRGRGGGALLRYVWSSDFGTARVAVPICTTLNQL